MSQYRETVVEVPNVNANLAVASESFPISTYTEIETKLGHVGCKLINYIHKYLQVQPIQTFFSDFDTNSVCSKFVL